MASEIAQELQRNQILAAGSTNIKSLNSALGQGFFGHLVFDVGRELERETERVIESDVDLSIDDTSTSPAAELPQPEADSLFKRIMRSVGL